MQQQQTSLSTVTPVESAVQSNIAGLEGAGIEVPHSTLPLTEKTLLAVDRLEGEHKQEGGEVNLPIQAQGVSDATVQRTPALTSHTEPKFIYASGRLKPHFTNLGLEKESEAATKLLNLKPNDFYTLFTYKDENDNQPYRYLAEQVSWILSIDNQDAYVLLPNSHDELNAFINTLEVTEKHNVADEVLSVAIGELGPVAPDALSNGQPLHMVRCYHLYHFTTAELMSELSVHNTTTTAIRDVLTALVPKPNVGESDSERAKNFLAYRYATIYAKTAGLEPKKDNNATDDKDSDQFLENLETKPSNTSPGRRIIDVILTYQRNVSGRKSTYYTSVDVTDLYPFLHSNLMDYVPSN
ncbi:hypothetical protein [uncultured Shewanella sp.]|uniref:cyanobactin maturation protease PatG family protein n=1 Tax=uncultured Shewanella sp. TaxID=173975 RepID=UPI0026314CEC|nr:hypothetical protein [uncultured Shewanella sp.]